MSLPESSEIEILTAEILLIKQRTIIDMIELGRRLIIVKEKLKHGAWGDWLEKKVEFSQSTANRFMNVAKKFSNYPTLNSLSGLTSTKLFELLVLSEDECKEFIQSNPVSEMTTRELHTAILAKKEAEKMAVKAEEIQLSPQTEVIPEDYEKLKTIVKEQQTELNKLTRAQLINKDKQKVKTDATLLIKELVRKTDRLKLNYTQAGEHDQDTNHLIELAAETCDRIAQELRFLIRNRKNTGPNTQN